jgi:flagellar motor protein MotB
MKTRRLPLLALLLLLTGPASLEAADESKPADGTTPADATKPAEDPKPADQVKPPEEHEPGEAVERHLSPDQPFRTWTQNPDALAGERGDRLETKKVQVKKPETVKLHNVVPPIHFESGAAKIPPDYVEKLTRILESMRYRKNVRVHFVGHADSQRLSAELQRQFGDNMGLSRERAGEVAEYFKKTLGLPPESITYEWVGDTQPVAGNDTEEGRTQNRRVEVEVWYDEIKDAVEEQEVLVSSDVKQIKVCRTETVCKLRYKEGAERRARVRNLVVPLRYEDESTPVSEDFTRQVRQALDNLKDRQGVTVRFIGYTDDAPLGERDKRIYGDALALSKARARRVALAMKDSLKVPSSALESDGHGADHPVASNDTPQGRALNRRVEVEFWYDDPLQELPDEPVICPDGSGEEMVTKVYDPPWGPLPRLEIENGQPVVPPGLAENLRRALNDIADRKNPRLRFVGFTKNEHLDRRTAGVYGDDVGLSADRARRAQELLLQDPALTGAPAEHEGRGYVQSDDVVNGGFLQGDTSFVRVEAVYDEPLPLLDYDNIDITKINRTLTPKSPYELNTMRISVDGQPIDDPDRSSSDVQRCTDVALDGAKIRFHFDDLESRPRLGVSAHPVAATAGDPIRFRMYSNYAAFLDHSEIRLYGKDQSTATAPLAIVPIDAAGLAEWRPDAITDPVHELKYVLRSYDAQGHFDETEAQPLWIYRDGMPEGTFPATPATAASAPIVPPAADRSSSAQASPAAGTATAGAAPTTETAPSADAAPADAATAAGAAGSAPPPELLAAYGESDLQIHRIPLAGGAVRVQGSGIPPGHTVWVAGHPVPVDPQGNFVAEEILPNGAHTVEVAVLDDSGSGSLYLRDLEFKKKDLFYVGVADLTFSQHSSNGPVDDLQGDNAPQPWDSRADGRLAFYLNGKISDEWRLTTSADTREAPFKDLFSNFLDKSPGSLFRRIDPDYTYPTFGDDGVVEEMAPTLGKFYIRATHDDDYAMFGNFKIGYLDNELAHVDRGLYGVNARYGSEDATSFGEQKGVVEGFAAQPGTVPAYEEFRGTGGSLYYLRHQDVLIGSERLRIELRDKDSGLVTGVVNLRPAIDYDIDWIQGRVVLTEPLTSTAADNQLVRSNGLSGDEAWLVVRYEFTPGFGDLNADSYGGQGHYWLGDHVKVGLTASSDDQGGTGNDKLGAADVTVRVSDSTFFKLQGGHTEGLVSSTQRSDDGGYAFGGVAPTTFTDADADAYRADVSVGLGQKGGRVTLYGQTREAGYTAPGQQTLKDTDQYGLTFHMPVTDRLSLGAKGDERKEDLGLETRALELDARYRLTDKWSLSGGVRNDLRDDHSPIVPLTQDQGERTDAVAQLTFDQGISWKAFGFAQGTIAADDTREDNGRLGLGGSWRPTQRFRLDAEASDGDLGPGGRLGTTFLYSDRTNLYLNYSLENERTDNGLRVRRGNLVSGAKRRLSDTSSVYVEERYQDGAMTGLTHATGINLVTPERWNFGASGEVGTLRDQQTAAETDRKAGTVRMGYGADAIQFSSAVEYRNDQQEQPDLTQTERTTWLFRNTFKLQLTPDWRLLGKLDHSKSDSSLGAFYDGRYTEAVVGYAYRPVRYDRLSALAKFTFFYNVPTADQVTLIDTPAEFIQKSHIAALDLTYDLTTAWSVGGKVAYRQGQVSLDRVNPEFFDNAARFLALRADWRFRENWEGMIEGRQLDLPDIDQSRRGALATVYRYFGKHLKAGAGYNFTDFSDDLTDLSYDHQGFFINLVGSM